MKLKFIGVGAAFTTAAYYQSNVLITAANGKKILIDCGSDVRFALSENGVTAGNLGSEIDAVYISHLHADHIGGLEWVAFGTYFNPSAKKPVLFAEEKMMSRMWHRSLRGGLWLIDGHEMQLTDYFDCRPLGEAESFTWQEIHFQLVKMPHVIAGDHRHDSFGLIITDRISNRPPVFFSTDALFRPQTICDLAPNVSLILHDCETAAVKTGVHSHYDDLRTLPGGVKQKMWLYHYQPTPHYQPVDDGFLGFIEKGQEFAI